LSKIYLKKEIEQKKKAMLAEIKLREAIESSVANWHIDTATTSNGLPSATAIEQVDACLNYLRQAVRDLGGELAITAKFPEMVELEIDSVKTMSDWIGDRS
jgi:bisphosphoglycerate-independent phosphoglycerate mutase (AlkP superfamily)